MDQAIAPARQLGAVRLDDLLAPIRKHDVLRTVREVPLGLLVLEVHRLTTTGSGHAKMASS